MASVLAPAAAGYRTAPRPEATERQPVTVSTAVRPLLDGMARGRVLAVFPTAVYVEVDDGTASVLAVLTHDAVRLPNALVLALTSAAAPFARHSLADHVGLGRGTLRIGPVVYDAVRTWTPQQLTAPVGLTTVAHRVTALRARLDAGPVALEPAVDRAARSLRRALVAADPAALHLSVDGLLGLGAGLTPAGDDVLAGVLAVQAQLPISPASAPWTRVGYQLSSYVVERSPGRTTSLSVMLLRLAARGECSGPVVAVLEALAGLRPLPDALERLLAVGHTSGHDTARGLEIGASALCTAAHAVSTPRQEEA